MDMSAEIEKMLDGRLKKSGEFPPFWSPQNEGESLTGMVMHVRQSPWARQDGSFPMVYHVKELASGEEFTTPTNITLCRLLEDEKVKVGDVLKMRYDGKQPTKKGRSVKLFSVGIMRKDEYEKYVAGKPTELPPPPSEPPPTPPVAPTPVTPETAKKLEEPKLPPPPPSGTVPPPITKAPAPEGVDEKKYGEIRTFMTELFGFYSKMRPEDLDNYLNKVRSFNVPIDVALEWCKDIVVKKDDGFIYKM